MSDLLFDMTDSPLPRLTRARMALEKAQTDLETAERDDEQFDGFGVDGALKHAVRAAERELRIAENEALSR